MRLRIALLLATISLIATACGSDAVVVDTGTDGEPGSTTTTTAAPEPVAGLAGEIAAAQERWAQSDITDYVIEWSPTCFCPAVTFTDTIVNGEVVSHEADGETFYETTGKTMPDLISEVQLALDDEPFRIEAEFDPETGAVRSYYVDVEEMMADEEHGVVVHSVTPTTAELPGAPVITATNFAVDHGCGHGFAKGSVDQTLGFVMFFTGEFSDEGPSLAEPIDLATDSEWTARIETGADLFANWCDDAIEEDDPTPRIDVEYRVTQGILVGSVEDSTASATLTDIVAEPVGGDGEIIELAELSLRNDLWGFFAG